MSHQIAGEVNGIVDDNSGIAELLVQQKAFFRLLAAKGFTQDLLHHETAIATTSLSEYATGKTKMSLTALRRVAAVPDIPLELLSLLLPPGMVIVRVPAGVDYDDISEGCRSYLDCKERAHHPQSEAGRDIGPGEQSQLDAKVVSLRAAGR